MTTVEGISPAQVRGARGMLDWSMTDLSRAARVSVSTVKRFEGGGTATVSEAAAGLIRSALEAAGVQFLADDGDGSGVCLRPRPASPLSRFF